MGTCVSAPPNEAALIYGPSGTRIAVGATTYRRFFIDKVSRLSLELYTIKIVSTEAETQKGVPINVVSVCQVKVNAYYADVVKAEEDAIENDKGATNEMNRKKGAINNMAITVAAQHFLGRPDEEIKAALRDTLEGHQREILGTLTVETLYKDKAELSNKVRKHVVGDLRSMGFSLVSFVVKSIDDSSGYMDALGQEATALVKRQAEEGTAKNQAAASIRVAHERAQEREQVQKAETGAAIEVNRAKELEAESLRDLKVKEAAFRREVSVATAEAESAQPIELARQRQFVVREQVKQEGVEEEVRFGIAKQKVDRQKLEEEGQSEARLLAETNDAKAIVVSADAEAARVRAIGQADADVILLKGQAEAEVLKLKGQAEAKVLNEKAEAFKHYGDAAITQLVVEKLPDIAREIAAPLAKTEKMVFISQDGKAASGLTNDVTSILGQLPHVVHGLTGFNMLGAAENFSKQLSKQDVGTAFVSNGDAKGIAEL